MKLARAALVNLTVTCPECLTRLIFTHRLPSGSRAGAHFKKPRVDRIHHSLYSNIILKKERLALDSSQLYTVML